MPEIPVDTQIFDIVFHPTFSTIYAGLLTGHVKAFAYDQQGNHKGVFSLRPSKRSCRGLGINEDGSCLYAVGKSKALHIIDTQTEQIETRAGAHEYAINRVKHLAPWLLTTGDDEGVIKLWDPRQRDSIRTYTHHFDYISDFLWLDSRQLVATSADGTLSVMDIRSKKPTSVIQSEDQEDELLSIVAIKGASKIIIGTQLGILSVFNRSSGWKDCVDRIPGHPLSIDTLCNLPPDLPEIDTTSTILTGSSDGYVRAVQIFPTKLLGIVADHGDWPVERIAVGAGKSQLSIDGDGDKEDDRKRTSTAKGHASGGADDPSDQGDNGSASRGYWWVGSVGHDGALRLTDLMAFFRDGKNDKTEGAVGVESDNDVEGGDSDTFSQSGDGKPASKAPAQESEEEEERKPSVQEFIKRKRHQERDPIETKKKKGRKNALVVEDVSFFEDL